MMHMADLAQAAHLSASMQALIVILVLVSLIGLLWSTLLLRRSRDWRIRLLLLLLGLVPVYQTVVVVMETGVWGFRAVAQVKAFSDLAINVLFLITVFVLESTLEKRRSDEVTIRVLEPALTLERPHERLAEKPPPKPTLPQQAQ